MCPNYEYNRIVFYCSPYKHTINLKFNVNYNNGRLLPTQWSDFTTLYYKTIIVIEKSFHKSVDTIYLFYMSYNLLILTYLTIWLGIDTLAESTFRTWPLRTLEKKKSKLSELQSWKRSLISVTVVDSEFVMYNYLDVMFNI